jgi:hypothetical protein
MCQHLAIAGERESPSSGPSFALIPVQIPVDMA